MDHPQYRGPHSLHRPSTVGGDALGGAGLPLRHSGLHHHSGHQSPGWAYLQRLHQAPQSQIRPPEKRTGKHLTRRDLRWSMRTFCFCQPSGHGLPAESGIRFPSARGYRCLLHSIAVAYYCDRLAGYLQALRFQRRQLLQAPYYTTISSTTGMTRTPPTGSTVFITPPGPFGNALQDFSLDPVEQKSSCATCSPDPHSA